MIFETHCHLDYLKENSLKDVFDKSAVAGVDKFLTIAVEPNNYDTVRELSHRYEHVYYTQGTHPHDAKLMDEKSYKKIRERANDPKMLAVGEIGLDYHYDNSPRDTQREVFSKQLQLASELNKPVVIHSRDADQDTINMLDQHVSKLQRKGVIHSFTSGPELAKFAIAKGFYLGLNGIITFKSAKAVREIVKMTPLKNILLETDAPFLTPVPHRGKENAPFYLPHIAEKIAEIKEVAVDEVLTQCYQNSMDLFRP